MTAFDIRPDDLSGPEIAGLLQEHLDSQHGICRRAAFMPSILKPCVCLT